MGDILDILANIANIDTHEKKKPDLRYEKREMYLTIVN